jgi:hypothetical protein
VAEPQRDPPPTGSRPDQSDSSRQLEPLEERVEQFYNSLSQYSDEIYSTLSAKDKTELYKSIFTSLIDDYAILQRDFTNAAKMLKKTYKSLEDVQKDSSAYAAMSVDFISRSAHPWTLSMSMTAPFLVLCMSKRFGIDPTIAAETVATLSPQEWTTADFAANLTGRRSLPTQHPNERIIVNKTYPNDLMPPTKALLLELDRATGEQFAASLSPRLTRIQAPQVSALKYFDSTIVPQKQMLLKVLYNQQMMLPIFLVALDVATADMSLIQLPLMMGLASIWPDDIKMTRSSLFASLCGITEYMI